MIHYSLVMVASKFHPLTVIKYAITLLLPSSPFVIHSEFLEPLVECYLWLQTNGLALKLALTGMLLRHVQLCCLVWDLIYLVIFRRIWLWLYRHLVERISNVTRSYSSHNDHASNGRIYSIWILFRWEYY